MKIKNILCLYREEHGYESHEIYDLFFVEEKHRVKLEKLLKDMEKYEKKNHLIYNLDEYFSNNLYQGDYLEGTRIYITPFIRNWFGLGGAYRLEYENAFYIFNEELRNEIFDSIWLFHHSVGNKLGQQDLAPKDKYLQKINSDTEIDYNKLKHMLIAKARKKVNDLLAEIDSVDKKGSGTLDIYLVASEYKKATMKELFFDKLKDFDENILPTLDSYWNYVFDWHRNHPLDKYYRMLTFFNPYYDDCISYNISEETIMIDF